MEILTLLAVLVLVVLFLFIVYFESTMYFSLLNFEKNPMIMKIIDNILTQICIEENVPVFYKTMDELNSDDEDKKNEAVGKYYYFTSDKTELAEQCKSTILQMIELEKKYGESYAEICIKYGYKPYEKDIFTYPRIEIAKDYLCSESSGLSGHKSFYSTWLHELGHHFAVKDMGKEHNEDDANRYAKEIIINRLPSYFKLMYEFYYDIELSFTDRIVAIYTYYKIKLWHKNSL